MINRPDHWMILKVYTEPKPHFRVFATWSGGYLDSDSWRLNSGIEKIVQQDNSFEFIGASGSSYICRKNMYGSNAYGYSVVTSLIKNSSVKIEILDEDEAMEYIKSAS